MNYRSALAAAAAATAMALPGHAAPGTVHYSRSLHNGAARAAVVQHAPIHPHYQAAHSAARPRMPDGFAIPSSEIMPVAKIHPGMEGYGLTVFHGTTISRFKVKVIDILRKQYMGRDLILCRMSGGPITERGANIIAGMSGSPVYFDGKLAGAVSMGYEWPKEPVAMVTPIEYMSDAFNPRLPARPQFTSLLPGLHTPAFADAGLGTRSEGPGGGADDSFTARPLLTPIFASGISAAAAARFSSVLAPYGLRVESGPGGGKAPASANTAPVVPGSMIGVYFCTGDIELGGYGTVTYRRGNHILAFGHPLMELGPIDFPISRCYVADVFSGYPRSEKMCLDGPIVGSLKQDRPWSVMGVIGQSAHMVPLTLSVMDDQLGSSRTFHVQCIDHPLLTSMVADLAAQEAVSMVRSYPAESMVDVRVEVDPVGMRPVVRQNTFFDYLNPQGMGVESLAEMDRILDLLENNPFRVARIGAIKVSMHIRAGRDTSTIERIAIEKSTVAPGGTIRADVTLRRWKGATYVVPMGIKVPADAPTGAANLIVTGGMLSGAAAAPTMGGGFVIGIGAGGRAASDPASSLDDMITRFLKTEKNTDLVGRVVLSQSPSLNVTGERLYDLPPAISAAIQTSKATGAFPLPDEAKTIYPMSEMIVGAQSLPITIRRDDDTGKPSTGAAHPGADDTAFRPDGDPGQSSDASASDSDAAWAGAPGSPAADTSIPIVDPVSNAGMIPADVKGGTGNGGPGGTKAIVPPGGASAELVAPHKGPTPTATTAATSTPTLPSSDAPADAIEKKLQVWTLHTESDFGAGRATGVSVSSMGSLTIAPHIQKVKTLEKESFVWVARPDGERGMFIGTGNNGMVYRMDLAQNLSVALKTTEMDVLSLATGPNGVAYAGTAPHGAIYRIPANGPASADPFFKTGRRYVLALVVDHAGSVYAGTNGGCIYKINPDGVGSVWFQSDEAHICSLAVTASGDILAGTSPSGLVYRITPDGHSSVLWDSDDTSVSALAALPNGDILAGTAPKGQIIRISADGSGATQVLKTDKPVHDMALVGSSVYVASGTAIYQILPSNEVRKITNQDDQDLLTLGAMPTGGLIAGTGNIATIYAVGPGDGKNLYRTQVRDADGTAVWGHIRWTGDQPAGSTVGFETRSGNTALPDASWSPWASCKVGDDGSSVASPKARYIQMRVSLMPGARDASSVIRSISLTYIPENRPPTVTLTTPIAGALVHGKSELQWLGHDPDGDALLYTVSYSTDDGTTWQGASIIDKDGGKAVTTPDVTGDSYQWDTTKLKDGPYLLRVEVSDQRSNPGHALRASVTAGPFTVLNAEPKITTLPADVKPLPDGSIQFSGAVDGLGAAIVEVNYRVDGGPWFSTTPASGFFDSQKVSFGAATSPLGKGDHKLEVQAVNAAGVKTVTVVPLKPPTQPVPALVK